MNQQNSLNLNANGVPQMIARGSYVYALIRTATSATEVSFDGQNWQPANQNDQQGPFNPPRQNIYFRASGGVASVVTFSTGLTPFASQSVAQQVASTFAYGNGGAGNYIAIPAAQVTGGGNYDVTNGIRVNLGLNGLVKILGVYQGHLRKQITFDNSAGTGDVVIFDSFGNLFLRILAGKGPLTYELSDTFYVGGNAGASAKFLYNETYFNS